jgi:hypothetical protein
VWLVTHGYAAPTYQDAVKLACLPYSMWGPSNADRLPLERDLFSNSPLTARIAMEYEQSSLLIRADDWYTPKEWTDRVLEVMGSIDLDPASCHEANRHCVNATKWYSKEINGLDPHHEWFGNVYLNPPYGRDEMSARGFMGRLRDEVLAGNVKQAVTCIQDWSIGVQWFRPIWELDTLHCTPWSRIQFIAPHGTGKSNSSPNKGNIFTYIGPHKERFAEVFGKSGTLFARWTAQ